MSDRKSRKEKLLNAARQRLKEEQDEEAADAAVESGPQMMYRGQVVRPPSGATRSSRATPEREARVALEKVKSLYRDGLITRAEAEAKRSEILDRL